MTSFEMFELHGDRGESSCAHLSGECQFHAKSQEPINAFWLVLVTEHEAFHVLNVVIDTRRMRLLLPGLVAGQNRLADSLQQTVDASKFPNIVGQFTQQPSCTIHI